MTWANWPGMTDEQVLSWVTSPGLHLYGRCDRCGKRRCFINLYDVYPETHFGWVCADCLIEVLSDKAAR